MNVSWLMLGWAAVIAVFLFGMSCTQHAKDVELQGVAWLATAVIVPGLIAIMYGDWWWFPVLGILVLILPFIGRTPSSSSSRKEDNKGVLT